MNRGLNIPIDIAHVVNEIPHELRKIARGLVDIGEMLHNNVVIQSKILDEQKEIAKQLTKLNQELDPNGT